MEIIPFYFDFFNKYLLAYGSLLVILRFCTIQGEPIEDHSTCVVTAEHDFINCASFKFFCCLHGMCYYRNISGEIQMKDIGSELFLFLMRIKNKTFVHNLLLEFSKCYKSAFGVGSFDSILGPSPNTAELVSFFDGLTDNGKHLEYLKQNYPFFIQPIERLCAIFKNLFYNFNYDDDDDL